MGYRNPTGDRDGSRSSRTRWLRRLNDSDHVLWLLFGLSFLETIILPVPIELVLIPFMLANRHRLWRIAAFVTAGCLAASLVGYAAGYFLLETAGRWLVNAMGWEQGYQHFQTLFDRHGFWAILAAGVIPIPFQTAMLTAGAAAYPVWKFVLAATLARSIRYYGLAVLVYCFGEKAQEIWEKHKIAAILGLVAVLGVIWALTQWLGGMLV